MAKKKYDPLIMTDQGAYDRLLTERPVIIRVMERIMHGCETAEALAKRATNPYDDEPELRQLISQAARHLKRQRKKELTNVGTCNFRIR